jgi:hypothetical protein
MINHSILVVFIQHDPGDELRGLYFWYFLLTIQNTANRQVRNQFSLLAVFISFPLARCAPPPHPALLLGGRESTKKAKNKENRGRGLDGGCVFYFAGDFGLLEGS